MPAASWVIRNRETKEVLFETFNPATAAAINASKYEAVPILAYLQEVARDAKGAAK